jgi:hypothetical protein
MLAVGSAQRSPPAIPRVCSDFANANEIDEVPGYTLLDKLRASGDNTPLIVYAAHLWREFSRLLQRYGHDVPHKSQWPI